MKRLIFLIMFVFLFLICCSKPIKVEVEDCSVVLLDVVTTGHDALRTSCCTCTYSIKGSIGITNTCSNPKNVLVGLDICVNWSFITTDSTWIYCPAKSDTYTEWYAEWIYICEDTCACDLKLFFQCERILAVKMM